MQTIQLLVSDMDGTLVQLQKHEVSDRVRSAVIAAENAGVKVVPVTGRPYESAKSVMTVLGFDSFCVVDNGATIRSAKTGEIIWSNWLELRVVREVVAVFLPYSTKIDYSPEYNEHIPNPTNEMNLVLAAAPYVFSFVPTDSIPEILDQLKRFDDIAYYYDAHSTDSTRSAIQVTHKEATKYYGVEALRKILGISKEHTMAIGDGINDIPLFDNAGLKIAMGNATDALKAVADHVVGTVEEDGVAQAIDTFILA